MSTNKHDGQLTALRRSSRSTRGSVKPIMDLTKSELSDDEPRKNKSKSGEEDIQHLDRNNDDDLEEQVSKKKRATKNKRQSTTILRKKQPVVFSKIDKTHDDGVEKKGAESKSSIKSKKCSAKSIISNEQDTNKTNDYDVVNICYEFSEREMKEINNAFNMNCSTDGEDLLDKEELKTAIRALGFEPRADEIHNLSEKFANKIGKINRDRFHKIMALKMSSSPGTNDNILNDEISKVFNLLDLDKTGMITLDNLKAISKELNEEITDEELHEMIVEADLDNDSQINKQEFYNIMKKTSLY